MGVIGRVVAAGAGRDPAAEGRSGEALREVPQRIAVGPQLVLQVRAEDASLDPGRPGSLVDLQHLVQLVERDRDHRPRVRGRGDAADRRAAAAVGDSGVTPVRTPGQHRFHLALSARVGHHVRRVRVAAEHAEQGTLAAVGVIGPLPGVLGAEGGQVLWRGDARGAELERVGRGNPRRRQLHAQLLRQLRGGRRPLLVAGLLRLQPVHPQALPPLPVAHAASLPPSPNLIVNRARSAA